MRKLNKTISSLLFAVAIIGGFLGKNNIYGITSEIGNAKNSVSKTNVSIKSINSNLEAAKVIRHVDGDTIEVEFDKVTTEHGKTATVRFLTVDTPETVKKGYKVEPMGPEASNYTKSQILGKLVYLEKDKRNADDYGRLLRAVWLEAPKDNSEQEIRIKMLNAILVQKGYARADIVAPDVKYASVLTKIQNEAIKNNIGMWQLDYFRDKYSKIYAAAMKKAS